MQVGAFMIRPKPQNQKSQMAKSKKPRPDKTDHHNGAQRASIEPCANLDTHTKTTRGGFKMREHAIERLVFFDEVLPDNIESLIEQCEVVTPIDVWMEYLATLPPSTTNEDLNKLQSRFMPAIRSYIGPTCTDLVIT
ncbi:hypothetical protein [Aeromonas veronii]|uniref:hypothetical protein n=1 Tax=Aeromonas veronii TaxID=654 RepID=UPI00224697CF|nr:hypothetical protein [Aeromonas veronii]MCX0435270.1 hypothetical protein [Aeromonas veronii]